MKSKLNISPDCSNIDYLPDIRIEIPLGINQFNNNPTDTNSTFTITLKAEDYLIEGKKIVSRRKKKGESPDLDYSNSDEYNECHAAFMAINVPPPRGPILVFGEYFMRKFYTVFDRDRLMIGFAESKEENELSQENILTPYDEVEVQSNENSGKSSIKAQKEETEEDLIMSIFQELQGSTIQDKKSNEVPLISTPKEESNAVSKENTVCQNTSSVISFDQFINSADPISSSTPSDRAFPINNREPKRNDQDITFSNFLQLNSESFLKRNSYNLDLF